MSDEHHGASGTALHWPPPARRPPGKVTATKVDPLAWQTALALAGGDARRLRVLDRRTVLVVNQAGPR